MNGILLTVAICIMVVCIAVVLWNTSRVKKIMLQLDDMLEAVINNRFEENTCDESQMSRLEVKLKRFLVSSSISYHNIETEKDGIKSLISDISHQTKTPIANILLYSQLLQEQTDLAKSCLPLAKQISVQTEKLNFLIQSLIKTSRLENGIVQLASRNSDIKQLVELVLQECKQKALEKRITIDTDISQQLIAYFDAKWTGEALYNILDNAIKYTPQDGHISIAAVQHEMFCCIDVVDSGMGISEEEQPKIFRRFYRSSSVSDQEGAGIGLFLARKIITAQGGYIKVDSMLENGSTFSVFLPKINNEI